MSTTFWHRWFGIPYSLNIRHKRRIRKAQTTYLFLHGLGDTGDLWKNLVGKLPKNVNYLTFDLLGFGDSARPKWAKYDARAQARSVLATYLKQGITGPVTVIGHSLGALVAVEFARRYPLLTQELVLCSPPIYEKPSGSRIPKRQEDILRSIYRKVSKTPKLIVHGYGLGRRIRLFTNSLNVVDENVDVFVKSLNASIINQRTIDDIARLNKPITILNGLLDPLVVRPNLVKLTKNNDNIKLIDVPASHSVVGLYEKAILKVLSVKK